MGKELNDYSVEEPPGTKVIISPSLKGESTSNRSQKKICVRNNITGLCEDDNSPDDQIRPGVKVIKLYTGRSEDEFLKRLSDKLVDYSIDKIGISIAVPILIYYIDRKLFLTSSLLVSNLILASKLKNTRQLTILILMNFIILAIVFATKGVIKARVFAIVLAVIGILLACSDRWSLPYLVPLIVVTWYGVTDDWRDTVTT